MSKTILHSKQLNHAPKVVWKYISTKEFLSEWLMETDFELKVGHEFQFWTKPKFSLGFDGRVYCKVLEFKENESLKFSWKGGIGDKVNLDTIVTLTIIPNASGCELRLEQSGFKAIKNAIPYFIMGKGWVKILDRLSKKITIQ